MKIKEFIKFNKYIFNLLYKSKLRENGDCN